jgi:hypothetical protein
VILGCNVQRRARWALGVGLALAAAAASGARAQVRVINLDDCSASCIAPAVDALGAAEDDVAASITLSRFGDDAAEPNFALTFDRKAMPAALADGLPSPIVSVSAQGPEGRGVSPYAFFDGVIDIPHSADARAFAAASFFAFTPSLAGRRTITDMLWASQAFFEPPSTDVASRLALPLSADAGWQPTRVSPTPGFSEISGPASGAPVWDEWSCMWAPPLPDPWKESQSDPCR